MAGHSRYDITKEGAGVQGGVLKNKLNIRDQQLLEDIETILFGDTYNHFTKFLHKKEMGITLSFLFDIHAYFFKNLYDWTGKIRTVDISKDGSFFAPVAFLSDSLREFEKILQENAPKSADTKKELSKKFALIHCEFNVIHPFREGNGRTIRLFIDLMAIQNGYMPIDYKRTSHAAYIRACIAGMKKEYRPMEQVMYRGLKKIQSPDATHRHSSKSRL